MHPRRPTRFWNHLVLSTLVLLVTGTALTTVAASAETESHDTIAAGAAAGL